MGFIYRQEIPSSDAIREKMPLKEDWVAVKKARDKEVIDVMLGQSEKMLLIIGPCSADNEDAVCEYVARLAKLQEKVKDRFVLLPRIYTNKPRTTGIGYKGMAHQPDPREGPNIAEGILAIRRMHLRCLEESGLSAADEMLYPGNWPYLEDLLSYVAIGARSVENQEHRLTVSGLDIPIGMKNPTSGSIPVMLNSVRAAQFPHVFLYNGWEVQTPGNPLAHCILRGAVSSHGRNFPNYYFEDLMFLYGLYQESGLKNQSVIVDVSHANSNKQFEQQPRVAYDVMNYRKKSAELKNLVKGLMIESYLEEGAQNPSDHVFGKSITDACLGWAASEELVLKLADQM